MKIFQNSTIVMLMALLLLVASCGNDVHEDANDDNHDHAHDAGESTEQHTVFSGSMELFVEFDRLVINQKSKFLAHITNLSDYKPLETGQLTLKTGLGESVKCDKVSHSGIFIFDFTPKRSGKVYLKFTLETEQGKQTFNISGIDIFNSAHDAEHAVTDEHHDAVEFTKEQSWKTEFAIEKIEQLPFARVISTSGEIVQSLGSEYAVTANHSGIVSFSTKQITEGTKIRKNQTLVTIKSEDLIEDNIQTEYISAKADYEKYKIDFDRAGKLFSEKLITEKEYLDVKLDFDKSKNQYNTFAKNYNAGGNNVIAPVGGFVKQLKVLAGEHVETGQILAIISQNQRLVIKADLSQKYFGSLADIRSALFRTNYNAKVYDTNNLNGKLLSYSKSTNENSFFTSIYFEVDNRGDLISGSYIEIFLHCKETHLSVSVPVSAILDEQGQKFVFVQVEGELYEKRYVTTGDYDGKRVKILKGLDEGERVVTKGAYQVKLASLGGGLPASGHVH